MSKAGCGRWAAIELRHLTTLDAVAREGSFRRAAQLLGYVQSTVSQQVAVLEALTGERLVERARGTHSVALTAAGRALLAHANRVVAEMQAAEAELEALHVRDGRALHLGRVDRAGAALLPRLLASFQAREPAIALELEEVGSVAVLLERLESAELDAGFCQLPLARGAFQTRDLYRDRLVALAALSQGATNRRALASRELAALPLLARPSVDARLRAEGVEPRTVLRCDDEALLQDAAAAGAGIAILPATAVTRQDVAILELRPEITLPVTGVVHSRRGDTTLRALVDAACAASADLPHRTDRSMSLAVPGERA